jgi:hypothetical protein
MRFAFAATSALLLSSAGLMSFVAPCVQAQRPIVRPTFVPTVNPAAPRYSLPGVVLVSAEPRADSGAVPRTYWLEGGVVGGGLVGIGGAVLGAGLCSNRESGGQGNCVGATLLGFLAGAALGFPPGALIGGQFPKRHRSVTL